MRFEINEVIKGDRWDDLAITEIYFDGIDVHCLAKGTKILMADSSEKNIEELNIGDTIITFNETSSVFEKDIIQKLAEAWHPTYQIIFEVLKKTRLEQI